MKHDLIVARDLLAGAEVNFEDVVRRTLPVGEPTAWVRNGKHVGVVILHGYKGRLKVRNNLTDREYWIYAFDIIRALES